VIVEGRVRSMRVKPVRRFSTFQGLSISAFGSERVGRDQALIRADAALPSELANRESCIATLRIRIFQTKFEVIVRVEGNNRKRIPKMLLSDFSYTENGEKG
jgi:hypothetical protein